MEPKVSVIIPSWNRREDLRITLKSVFKQSYGNFEVIVIDNGSSDRSVEMVKSEFPSVKLITNSKNRGTGLAKNQGILVSKGEYILFCDSDIEMFNRDSIKNMVKLLKENPDIGAIGGEAYKFPSGKIVTKRRMITPNCETSTVIMDKDKYYLEDCGYVATCNCMMPKQLVLDCGGFDSNIIYSGEDKEIGIKIKEKGYKSVVDSRCLVYHYVSPTQSRKFFLFNKNRIRVVIKNYSLLRILTLPILDIVFAFDPKKFKDLKGEAVDVMKYTYKDRKKYKKKKLIIKIMGVGGKYFVSLVAAYIWNIIYLPKTISERIRKVNYLEGLDGYIKKK